MKRVNGIYEENLKALFDKKLIKNNYNFNKIPFILFGAGNLGLRTLTGLKKIGIKPVAFGDNDEKKMDTSINGIEVFSKEKIMSKYGDNILIVLTIWKGSTGKEKRVSTLIKGLQEFGFKHVVDITKLYNDYPDTFLPYYCIGNPENVYSSEDKILECYKLFDDVISKKQYYEQVKWRISHDNWEEFVDVDYNTYFQRDLYELNENDIIYDCGAFDGDTIRALLHKKLCFKKIISFEPDKNNFDKLKKFVEKQESYIQKKIQMFEYAVGNKEEILHFDATGDADSKVSNNGDSKVKSITIDNFAKENPQNIPTIIKMDIEGFEREALLGSEIIIKQQKPILAICVYHKQSDLWEIPLLINKISDGYKFYLRHHVGDCWDTVLYAIPKERRKIKEKQVCVK